MRAGRVRLNEHRHGWRWLCPLLLVVVAAACSDDEGQPSLNADTPCTEYLSADSETRSEAVRRVGLEIGNRGAGNPLAFGNTDFNCGQNPDQSLADAIGRP